MHHKTCHCEENVVFRGNPDNKKLFTKYKLTQHFFDRKETLHKETLSLISARYLFVISRLLKFQNSDFVLKHWNFLTQTSKTTNTLSNMLDLFFYKFFMIFTGSPRFAVLDLLCSSWWRILFNVIVRKTTTLHQPKLDKINRLFDFFK